MRAAIKYGGVALPEVIKLGDPPHRKGGSLAGRYYNSTKNQTSYLDEPYQIGTGLSNNQGKSSFQPLDSQSDERNSSNTLAISSEKESRGDYQSSSHSRKITKNAFNDRTIENLRNIKKAEQELRGIFQSVKYYEFPVVKDADGNVKLIGKYQPQALGKCEGKCKPIRAPSRVSYNPIVYDKAFKKVARLEDNQSITENQPIQSSNSSGGSETLEPVINIHLAQQEQQICEQDQENGEWEESNNFQNSCQLQVQPQSIWKQGETSTVASSTFYSDLNNNQHYLYGASDSQDPSHIQPKDSEEMRKHSELNIEDQVAIVEDMSALNLKKNHKKHKKASTNAYFEGNQTPKLLVGETQKGTSKVGKFSMRKRIQKFDSTRELQQVAHGNEEEKEI